MKYHSKYIVLISFLFSVNVGYSQIKTVPQITRLLNWVDTSGTGLDSVGYWDERITVHRKYTNNVVSELIYIDFKTNDTNSRSIYLYDNSNRIIEEVNYSSQNNSSTSHKLKKNAKRTYYYPDNFGSNESSTFIFDTLINNWKPTYRRKFIFDSKRNPISVFEETFQNGNWVTSTNKKSSYTYLGNTDLITIRIDSGYNTFTQKFDATVSDARLYDNNNNLTQITWSQYSNQNWYVYYKNIFRYVNGKNDQLVIYQYLGGDSTIYRYDNIKWKTPVSIYNPITTNAIPEYLSDYTEFSEYLNTWTKTKAIKTLIIDANGSNEIYSTIYSNNDSTEFKAASTYNNFKKLILFESFNKWTSTNWKRTNGNKYDFKYNNNVLYEFTNLPLVQDKYIFLNKEIYENFITISLSLDATSFKVKVFPNPSQDGTFRLDIPSADKVELYDLQGSLLRELSIKDYTIQIENIPNGLYLLVIYTNKGISRTKIAIN